MIEDDKRGGQGGATDRKAAIKRLRLLALTQKNNIETFKAKIEKEYCEAILPNKVECTRRDLGGVPCDVLVPELYTKHKVIFYIHGGSFVGGSAASYRGFCARVAHKTLCQVVIPDYRPAPHAFPTSLKDTQNAFCALFAEEQVAAALDNQKSMTIIMADGAGASIALSLISTLKSKYRECVQEAVLLSPWLDISDRSVVLSSKGARDEVMTAEGMRKAAGMYADDETRNSALLSLPLCTQQFLSTFPSVFIQMGEKEILLEDAKRSKEILEKAGGKCVLDVWPGMMHLFQLSNDLVWECRLAIDKIGEVVRAITADSKQGTTSGEQGRQEFFNQPPLEESI